MIEQVKYIKEAIDRAGLSINEMSELTRISRTSLHNWFAGKHIADHLRLSLVYRYAQCLNKAVENGLLPLDIERPKVERLRRIREAVKAVKGEVVQ